MNTTTDLIPEPWGGPVAGDEPPPTEREAADRLQQMLDLQDAARVALAWSPTDG